MSQTDRNHGVVAGLLLSCYDMHNTDKEKEVIITGIPYVGINTEITCSMSSCLTMLLQFYGLYTDQESLAEMFGHAYLSSGFRDWNHDHRNAERSAAGEMMACAQYLMDTQFRSVSSDIVVTDMVKIKLSYTKRNIPVILNGRFPLLSGTVPNTVLVKGYVDDYMIVNDPRGNAMSVYRDKLGENMLYSMDSLGSWVARGRVYVLRILPK